MRLLMVSVLLTFPSLCWAEASRDFDGVNDQIAYGTNLDVTTGDFTVCAWINPSENAAADNFASKKTGINSGAGYSLFQTTADVGRFRPGDGTTQQDASGATDLDGLGWVLLCGTWDSAGDDAYLYVNGTQDASDTAGTVGSLTNTNNFLVGEDSAGAADADTHFSYIIHHAKVLTAQELAELQYFPEGVSGSLNALLTIWGDATEQDLGPSDLTGTVTGTAADANGPPVMFAQGMPL